MLQQYKTHTVKVSQDYFAWYVTLPSLLQSSPTFPWSYSWKKMSIKETGPFNKFNNDNNSISASTWINGGSFYMSYILKWQNRECCWQTLSRIKTNKQTKEFTRISNHIPSRSIRWNRPTEDMKSQNSKVIQFTEKRIEHTLWIRLSFFNMYNKIGPKMRDSKNQAKIVTSKPAIRGAIDKQEFISGCIPII